MILDLACPLQLTGNMQTCKGVCLLQCSRYTELPFKQANEKDGKHELQ